MRKMENVRKEAEKVQWYRMYRRNNNWRRMHGLPPLRGKAKWMGMTMLHGQQERYRTILESADGKIVVTDPKREMKFVFVQQEWSQVSSYYES